MTPALLDLLMCIATTYDALPHTPTDTAVVRAYDAFKAQLLKQHDAIRALATETLAQSAWFHVHGRKDFAPQKACLLPDALIIEALEYRA